MNSNPILIVGGEPNSIFLEIFFKSLKSKKYRSPLILISSKKLLETQMKKLNFKKKIKVLDVNKLYNYKLNNKYINLIDVQYNPNEAFKKITNNSNIFIKKSFDLAFKILKKKKIYKFINGPISKKKFLDKKFVGMTEYISKHFSKKQTCMLIYNEKLSVCPVTTHLPLKFVSNTINKKLIVNKANLINNFYKKIIGYKPKIAILGLNPHCESVDVFNEDDRIIRPAVNFLKKRNINVSGPFSADTIFLKQNRKKYNVVLGMYHDQVLTPLKTLYEYDAFNLTIGLPFLRISPDHGPNEKFLGKNKSSPVSLIKAISFLDKN